MQSAGNVIIQSLNLDPKKTLEHVKTFFWIPPRLISVNSQWNKLKQLIVLRRKASVSTRARFDLNSLRFIAEFRFRSSPLIALFTWTEIHLH